MGIDLEAGGRRKSKHRTSSHSENPYIKLLIKLYKFLVRRTDSRFNKAILKRLFLSKINKPPMSLKKLVELTKGKDGIAVLVGKVTDDVRFIEVPKLRICALNYTKTARAKIEKNGGECLTFDQLAMIAPTGKGTILLRGARNSREAVKHFGKAPGQPHSTTKPYVSHKGRKFEAARGRRRSRGYKN